MKKILSLTLLFILCITCNCFADVFTLRISNLGAERFVQEYNNYVLSEHNGMNYFTIPRNTTPATFRTPSYVWPYEEWTSTSFDSKYKLIVRSDRNGYVSALELIGLRSDVSCADLFSIIFQMVHSGQTILNDNQVNSLKEAIQRTEYGYDGRIVLNDKLAISLSYTEKRNLAFFAGVNPMD